MCQPIAGNRCSHSRTRLALRVASGRLGPHDTSAANDGCRLFAACDFGWKREQHFDRRLQRHQMIGSKQHARSTDVLRAPFAPLLLARLTVPQRDPERIPRCARESRVLRVTIHQPQGHVPFKTIAAAPFALCSAKCVATRGYSCGTGREIVCFVLAMDVNSFTWAGR